MLPQCDHLYLMESITLRLLDFFAGIPKYIDNDVNIDTEQI